jgi:hypothetical protein
MVIVERLVELRLAGETEVLGLNLQGWLYVLIACMLTLCRFTPDDRSSRIHWTGCRVDLTVGLDDAENLSLPAIEHRFPGSKSV